MKWLMLLLAVSLLASDALAADECKLEQLASLEMTTLPDGKTVVPVKIADTDQKLELRIAFAYSAVLGGYSDSLKLEAKPLRGRIEYLDYDADETVPLPDVRIGKIHVPQLRVLRLQTAEGTFPAGNVGVLGLDLLAKFDMEFDFKSNRFNLYAPGHCPGNVVYWADSFVAMPLKMDSLGQIFFDVMLDGKQVMAGISTSSFYGIIDSKSAADVFGISASSPGAVPPPPEDSNDESYGYPFKSLTMDGIVITNPQMVVHDWERRFRCDGKPHRDKGKLRKCYAADMVLGLNQLRTMHLWFAVKERTLYVTPADAHR